MTKIEFGAVITLLIAVAGGISYVSNAVGNLEGRLEEIKAIIDTKKIDNEKNSAIALVKNQAVVSVASVKGAEEDILVNLDSLVSRVGKLPSCLFQGATTSGVCPSGYEFLGGIGTSDLLSCQTGGNYTWCNLCCSLP